MVILVAGSTSITAQSAETVPSYQPAQSVSGTIRLWGHGSFKSDFMGRLVAAWAQEFARYQPGVRLENHMYGTSSAIGALSLGAADIALLGEEISPAAAAEFRRVKHYAPTEIDVATGSLDVNFFDYAHVVFVNKDNPLSRLSLTQLDAIFGTEHRRGSRNIRTWDELGLGGEWAKRRITPYSWKDLDFSLFVQAAVLGGSHRWNPDLREYAHIHRADGSQYDAGQQIVDALAADKYGIAISSLRYATPQVKPLALAGSDGGTYYAATKENLVAQSYPLTRIVPAFVDRVPGRPLDPKVREFLRYVLSSEGQAALVRETGYLQLGAPAARAQRAKLDITTSVAANASAQQSAPSPGPSCCHAERSERSERSRSAAGTLGSASGTLRIWSSEAMRGIATRWRDGFHRRFPSVALETRFLGTDVALAALYTGSADVALVGRDATANEIQAFEWIHRYKPTSIAVMRGSLGLTEHSPALAILVQADNPLARLTLAQLEAIFGTEPRGGAPRIRTWDQLGLGGVWKGRTIELYGPDIYSGTGRFFRHVVMGDSRKFDWARMHEIGSSARIAAALGADRFGLAISDVDHRSPRAKVIALAGDEGGSFLSPTPQTIVSGRYPLARTVYAVIDRPPDRAAAPEVKDFLDFILSDSGQAEIANDGGYLPLSPLKGS